jgi:hypothetical protein
MDNVHRSTFKHHAVNAAPALTAPSPGPHRRGAHRSPHRLRRMIRDEHLSYRVDR